MGGLLGLDTGMVARARELAALAAAPVVEIARSHTTVAVERATLRLAGITGADSAHPAGDVPWVNRVVDTVAAHCGLQHGVALPAFHALRIHRLDSLTALAEATAAGLIHYANPSGA
ncbi:MAG: lysine 5,6-aminomutase subunit alpha TIM-barrel domain-containing protein, partial [Sciscionella sp.]